MIVDINLNLYCNGFQVHACIVQCKLQYQLSTQLTLDFVFLLQGIGKQGILLKESSTSSITDWKSRFFHLVEDGLLYFDSTESASQVCTIVHVHIHNTHCTHAFTTEGITCHWFI